jgi:hypothetical protein
MKVRWRCGERLPAFHGGPVDTRRRPPAGIYPSEAGPVRADRFRIGVGRRDPEPARAALGRFVAERRAPMTHVPASVMR